MQNYYENMMLEVNGRVSAIDLTGKHIIKECKTIIVFLKEELSGLNFFIESRPFENETEEITFFKH